MSVARRVLTGFVDQALASGSNILFLLAVARGASIHEFAEVTLAFGVVAFALGVHRASLGIIITLSPQFQNRVPWPISLILGIGVSLGGVALGAAVSSVNPMYLALVLSTPIVLLADAYRFSALAAGSSIVAVRADGVWFLSSLAAFILTFAYSADLSVLLALWIFGAFSAFALAVKGRSLRFAEMAEWWRSGRKQLRWLIPDSILGVLMPLVYSFALMFWMSAEAVAGVRGAGTLMGPVSLLMSAVPAVLLPELVRLTGHGRVRMMVAQTIAIVSIPILWCSCLLLAPDGVGRMLLGDAWEASVAVLVWVAVEMALFAFASGPLNLLRSYHRWKSILSLRAAYVGTAVIALGVALPSRDLRMVLIAMALAGALNALLTTLVAASSGREREQVRVLVNDQ